MTKHSLDEVIEKDNDASPSAKIANTAAFNNFLFEGVDVEVLMDDLDDTLELIDNWQKNTSANGMQSSSSSGNAPLLHDQQHALLNNRAEFNPYSYDNGPDDYVDDWAKNLSANVSYPLASSSFDNVTTTTDFEEESMLLSLKGPGDSVDDIDPDELDDFFAFLAQEPNHTVVQVHRINMLSSSSQLAPPITEAAADDNDKPVKAKRRYRAKSKEAPADLVPSTYSVNDLMKNFIHHLNHIDSEKTDDLVNSQVPAAIMQQKLLFAKINPLITEKASLSQRIIAKESNWRWLLHRKLKIDGQLLNLGHSFLNSGLHEQALQCYNNVYADYHPATPLYYKDIIQSLYELSRLQWPQDKEQARRLSESAYLMTAELYDYPEAAPDVIALLYQMAHRQLSIRDYCPAWENFMTNLAAHPEIFSAFAKPSARNADEIFSLQQSTALSPALQQQLLPLVTPCGNDGNALSTCNANVYPNMAMTILPEPLHDSGASPPIH